METWKPVTGYEGIYEVSNKGRVRGVERKTTGSRPKKVFGRILKQRKNIGGYYTVDLSKDGVVNRGVRVHRLVAKEFVENPDEKPIVNHLDGTRTNNCAENLEWCTHQENLLYAYSSGLVKTHGKLTDNQIRYIFDTYIPYRHSAKKIADELGANTMTVYAVLNGTRRCYKDAKIIAGVKQ